MERYDLAILGAGPGGYVAALRAADLGYKTALIEKDRVGGVCLNAGCIPTKALTVSCDLLDRARRAKEFGLIIPEAKADFALMKARKDRIVENLAKGILFLLDKKGVDLIKGEGRFKSREALEVISDGGKKEIKASRFIVATGSRPLEIPQLPFDHKQVIDSTDALLLKEAPKRILIVGGGAIGCEWASIFSSLTSKVSVVEMMGRLLPEEDSALGTRLAGVFKRRGVEIYLERKAESFNKKANSVEVILSGGEKIEVDVILVSCGRSRNVKGIGLEEIGIKLDKGAVVVDDFLSTSCEGVFAIGDVLSSPQLAHVASREGLVAVENLKEKKVKMDYGAVPACIFTNPPVASVGLAEERAAGKGIKAKSFRFPFSALGKAHALGSIEGFLQLVSDKASSRLIGAQVFGEGATEIIGELTLAIRLGLKAEDLTLTIHPHPTMSEAVQEAAHGILGMS
ncbi:MAG: dihydrolipoyl dehydrogenase [Candidatus Omnitrophica bacterium]|nr:dihydrolipoyl dehydrogenase [Candidatus Omnitrophota bacterium]